MIAEPPGVEPEFPRRNVWLWHGGELFAHLFVVKVHMLVGVDDRAVLREGNAALLDIAVDVVARKVCVIQLDVVGDVVHSRQGHQPREGFGLQVQRQALVEQVAVVPVADVAVAHLDFALVVHQNMRNAQHGEPAQPADFAKLVFEVGLVHVFGRLVPLFAAERARVFAAAV